MNLTQFLASSNELAKKNYIKQSFNDCLFTAMDEAFANSLLSCGGIDTRSIYEAERLKAVQENNKKLLSSFLEKEEVLLKENKITPEQKENNINKQQQQLQDWEQSCSKWKLDFEKEEDIALFKAMGFEKINATTSFCKKLGQNNNKFTSEFVKQLTENVVVCVEYQGIQHFVPINNGELLNKDDEKYMKVFDVKDIMNRKGSFNHMEYTGLIKYIIVEKAKEEQESK